jgi:hypothetical protein
MSKACVKDWKERPLESSGQRTFYDVTFDPTPERVRTWDTRKAAENVCREFQSMNVEVPSGKCEGFGVEESTPKYVRDFLSVPDDIRPAD